MHHVPICFQVSSSTGLKRRGIQAGDLCFLSEFQVLFWMHWQLGYHYESLSTLPEWIPVDHMCSCKWYLIVELISSLFFLLYFCNCCTFTLIILFRVCIFLGSLRTHSFFLFFSLWEVFLKVVITCLRSLLNHPYILTNYLIMKVYDTIGSSKVNEDSLSRYLFRYYNQLLPYIF